MYRLIADDADTARALWAVVGSGSSIAKTVYAYTSPDDPVVLLLGDGVVSDMKVSRWMHRCLDATAAIEGRGYPVATDVDVPIVLDDTQVPGNCVAGRLTVAGGKGQLVLGSPANDAVRLGAGGLAALYAGTPTATLCAAGLLSGGADDALAMLDAAFAGRPAYMHEYF